MYSKKPVFVSILLLICFLVPGYASAAGSYKTYTVKQVKEKGVSILVNQDNRLPDGYTPDNLVLANQAVRTQYSNTYIKAEVLPALEAMFKDAKKKNIDLLLFAGYRSQETQSTFYARAGVGNTGVAPSRASEHETGYAVDLLSVYNQTRDASFGETKTGIWLKNNCAKYGFILRYPKNKTDITKYIYEPWHFRYLGVDEAKKVTESGLCYEEYIKQMPKVAASKTSQPTQEVINQSFWGAIVNFFKSLF